MKCFRILFILLLIGFIAIPPSLSLETPQPSTSFSAETLRPLLNSERIKLKFGSYGIDILRNGEKIRISNLYSVENGKKTTRTLAVVVYPEVLDLVLSKEHRMIIDGQSIGAVFKENGWTIEKQHTYFGEIEASPKLARLYSLMGGIAPSMLATHVYDLFVSKHGTKFRYATIAEVHHPGYLDSNELKGIYGEEFERKQSINGDNQTILEIVEGEMKNI